MKKLILVIYLLTAGLLLILGIQMNAGAQGKKDGTTEIVPFVNWICEKRKRNAARVFDG